MIIQANSFRIPLTDNSVHAICTSPPYYGLRSYDLPPMVFGGKSDCRHVWQTTRHNPNPHGDSGLTSSGLEGGKSTQAQTRMGEIESALCQLCGAWLGSFGLEPTMRCKNPGGGGLFELKEDLTDDERAFVISELVKLGIVR